MLYIVCILLSHTHTHTYTHTGKLTTDQIRSGYAALKKIEDCITRNHFGDQLVEACDAFYTRVPHSFGYGR